MDYLLNKLNEGFDTEGIYNLLQIFGIEDTEFVADFGIENIEFVTRFLV